MLAGGVTESITHFAGHLRVSQEAARVRDSLDDPAHLPRIQAWKPPPLREPAPERPLDELPSQPFRASVAYEPDTFVRPVRLPGREPQSQGQPDPHPIQPAPLAPPHRTGSSGGGGSGGRDGESDPDVSPDQALAQIFQLNTLHDHDTLLMVDGRDPSSLHPVDAAAEIQALLRLGAETVPADLAPHGHGTGDALRLVEARSEAMRAEANRADPEGMRAGGEVPPGLGTYLDGVRQPDGVRLDTDVPSLPAAEVVSHDGLVQPGLEARTGGNISLNVATLLDDHTGHAALMVRGDIFTTDAIVQTNVLMSRAAIAVAGDSLSYDIVTGGNTTQNGAHILQHATGGAALPLGLRTPFDTQVSVDRIDGDFYDVRVLTQTNMLSDNDVTVQASFGSYAIVRTGGNFLANELPASFLNDRYDLIVVQGDHHGANLIFQTNILLNDALVHAFTDRSDATSQSISTGDNALKNVAAIDHYGQTTARNLDPALVASLDALGEGHLDSALSALLPAPHAGSLDILFITGDFYSINLIAQTNIVSNVDTVLQYAPDPGTDLGPSGAATRSTQAVSTGENQLANLASIATLGTTTSARFVGGAHYDDAILVQANIVSESSRITIGDTQALAHEVVAFTGLPAPDLPADPMPMIQTTQDAAFHHDLFHGMLA